MKRILCIDYNCYLLPENTNLNNILDAVQQPVSRDYENNRMIFRNRGKGEISLQLVDEANINPETPTATEPEL